MTGHVETNVRLLPCAFTALARVAARWRTSRDETVRRLLGEYVQAQEERDPDDRLTHISTVLRYPPMGRRAPAPRMVRPLRLRAEAGLLERARAVALRLPGQYERSHRDYQARTLTDAVMTAIAAAEHIADDFLEDLLPLPRQRAALSLWRLATAATATGPERAVLAAAQHAEDGGWPLEICPEDLDGPDDEEPARMRRIQLVARALEDEVAWHSPERSKVAANLARSLLSGPGARAGEDLLHEQGEDWHELYQDTLGAAGERRLQLLAGTTDYDFSGRGGTAVWRARRRVELRDFEDWLLSSPVGNAPTREIDPPGWMLRLPGAWHAHAPDLTVGGHPPQPYGQWVADGKLLCFPFAGRLAFWPLTPRPQAPGWTPVADIEPLVAAAGQLRPEEVSEFIEAVLIDWAHEFEFEDEPSVPIALDLPVDRAVEFGFLTVQDQHARMAEARAGTLRTMDAVIEAFRQDDASDEQRLERLRRARSRTREFARLARGFDKRIGAKFRTVRPTWRWPGGSVADTLLSGSPPGLVQCLALWAHRNSTRIREDSMRHAWNRAFDQYGRRM
ncbi:hypothetical protein ACWCQW_48035 [Streptomyces mirabilis]